MKKKLISIPLLLGILVSVTILTILFVKNITSPVDPKATESISFSIKRGESIDSIGQRLKTAGLIKSKAAFKVAVAHLGISKNIQAGEFQLNPSWPLTKVTQSLTLGRDDLRVTLIEGWRKEEFADELEKQFALNKIYFDKQQFLTATKESEGYLFPDTYFLPTSVSALEVSEILKATFDKKIDSQLKENIKNQGLSFKDGIILASIVEREVNTEEDRPKVAGILYKRLMSDWPLQADATIQYALGYQSDKNYWWKKNLTKQDIELNSPYNTYQQMGLPPTPICNPSLSTIQAVAFQKPTNNWFYISDLKGNIHYAETIEQHNQNISIYLHK